VRPGPGLTAALLIVSLGSAVAARAQGRLDSREELARSRPEAWALRWYSAALAPSSFGPVEPGRARGIELALDLAGLPSLSAEQRTVGFNGTKLEDLNRAPVAARARAAFGLPARFTVDVSWLPPVEVDGASANLLAVGVARPLLESGTLRLTPRLWLQTGSMEGDFVCPSDAAAAGDDPVANPYGCARPSEDRIELDQAGLDLALAWSPPPHPALATWIAISARALDSSFRVDALWSGLEDRSRLDYDGGDWTLAGGLSWRSQKGWDTALELRWTPLEVLRPLDGGGQPSDDSLLQVQATIGYRLR
jgi:hypothetical protein